MSLSKLPAKLRSSNSFPILVAIGVAAAARLAILGLYPLMDTTEARYAEIARKMVELGDWVTPWFDYGLPFWGKPPISFWLTAASFKAFGVSAFAARLPHWLSGCVLAWLVWNWLARRSRREAIYALALMAGSALFFAVTGAVTTDMVLALGTTLAMRGFWLALHGSPSERRREQRLFFLGIAIGLLAKGPIAAVLAGIPIAIWTVSTGRLGSALRDISWGRGLVLVFVLVVPWYVLAEWKTPGFLEYFLVGEHWQRFLVPGWRGDLYSHGHDFPRGSIWLFAVLAFMPWSLLVPILAWRRKHDAAPVAPEDGSLRRYLWLWALTPCLVFSAAGNILWTYVLPGLPALAIVTAIWLQRLPHARALDRLLAGGVAFTTLAALAIVIGYNLGDWSDRKSTKALVAAYQSRSSGVESLVFLRRRPLSAAFYSRGRAESADDVDELRLRLSRGPLFIAIDRNDLARVPQSLLDQMSLVSRRGDYSLYLAKPVSE